MSRKPVIQTGISARNWVWLILISIVFWGSIFYCCQQPWRFVAYLVTYLILVIIRLLLRPAPPKNDPLSEL